MFCFKQSLTEYNIQVSFKEYPDFHTSPYHTFILRVIPKQLLGELSIETCWSFVCEEKRKNLSSGITAIIIIIIIIIIIKNSNKICICLWPHRVLTRLAGFPQGVPIISLYRINRFFVATNTDCVLFEVGCVFV